MISNLLDWRVEIVDSYGKIEYRGKIKGMYVKRIRYGITSSDIPFFIIVVDNMKELIERPMENLRIV